MGCSHWPVLVVLWTVAVSPGQETRPGTNLPLSLSLSHAESSLPLHGTSERLCCILFLSVFLCFCGSFFLQVQRGLATRDSVHPCGGSGSKEMKVLIGSFCLLFYTVGRCVETDHIIFLKRTKATLCQTVRCRSARSKPSCF